MLPKISINQLRRINIILLILILLFIAIPLERQVESVDRVRIRQSGQSEAAGPLFQPVEPTTVKQTSSQREEQVAPQGAQQASWQEAERVSLHKDVQPATSVQDVQQATSLYDVEPPSLRDAGSAPLQNAEQPPESAGQPGPSFVKESASQGHGTNFQSALESVLGVQSSDFDTLEVTATGYYAGPESTGKDIGNPEYGITYSGVKVRRDTVSTIAADPRVLPLGSLLFIPGYGYGVVADTGSAIKGRIIDLYFETKQDVYQQWGKKKLKVLILKQGSGKVTESMLDHWNQAFAELGADPALM